jgi:opacity protein-like surface antigen
VKKLFSIFFVVLLLCSLSFSQDKKAELYIGGGLSFPMQPEEFSDFWSMGFNFGGGLGYIFSPNFSGNAYLSYNTFGLNDDEFLETLNAPSGVTLSGGSVSIIVVTANIKALLIANPNQVTPYLLAGVGLFSLSTSDVTVSYQGSQQTGNTSNSESALGLVFGGGVDIPVSPTLKIFLEIGYAMGFTEGESTGYLPIKGGLIILL